MSQVGHLINNKIQYFFNATSALVNWRSLKRIVIKLLIIDCSSIIYKVKLPLRMDILCYFQLIFAQQFWGQVLKEDTIFYSLLIFACIKACPIHLTEIEFHLLIDALCLVYLKIVKRFLRIRILNVLKLFIICIQDIPLFKIV